MSQSLFTTQVPTDTDQSDGGAAGITTATTIQFATAGAITAVRFFATATVGGTYTGAVWHVTSDDNSPDGDPLAEATAGSVPTGAAWNTIALGPVSVSTNQLYRIGLWNSQGRYVATGHFFQSSGLTNGDITAYQSGTDPIGLGVMRNGTFRLNAAIGYPGDSANEGCYFVDVLFDAAPAVIDATLVATAPAATASNNAIMSAVALTGSAHGPLPVLNGAGSGPHTSSILGGVT